MAITLQDCFEYCEWAIDADLGSGGVPRVLGRNLINGLGTVFTSSHPWRWCLSPPTDLPLVVGQSWVELPSDFLAMRAEVIDSSVVGSVRLVSPQEFLERRAGDWVAHDGFYVGQLVLADDAAGKPENRIELWPVPGGGGPSQITVSYRRGWKPLVEDHDRARMPVWCEELFLSLLEAHVKGRFESDVATLAERIDHERRGPLWRAAVKTDGMGQRTLGRLRGGMHTHHRPNAGGLGGGLASFVGGPE